MYVNISTVKCANIVSKVLGTFRVICNTCRRRGLNSRELNNILVKLKYRY